MPSIEITDLSEETYASLERTAAAAGQSLPQYVRALVLREAGRPLDTPGGPGAAGPGDQARRRRTQQAFGGESGGEAPEGRERWRDL